MISPYKISEEEISENREDLKENIRALEEQLEFVNSAILESEKESQEPSDTDLRIQFTYLSSGAWETAKASNVLQLLDFEQANDLGGLYSTLKIRQWMFENLYLYVVENTKRSLENLKNIRVQLNVLVKLDKKLLKDYDEFLSEYK